MAHQIEALAAFDPAPLKGPYPMPTQAFLAENDLLLPTKIAQAALDGINIRVLRGGRAILSTGIHRANSGTFFSNSQVTHDTTTFMACPLRGADAKMLQAIDDFIHGFISFEPKATNIMHVVSHAPDCCIANTYTAMLWMLLEAPIAANKARPLYRSGQSDAWPAPQPREQTMTQAIRAWVDGDVPKTIALCEAILGRPPPRLWRR